MKRESKKQTTSFGKLLLFTAAAVLIILVGYFTSRNSDKQFSAEINQEATEKNFSEDRIGEDELIYAADGNVYSSDKRWVWSEEKNDWIQNSDLKPTERALKAASNVFVYASESDQNKFIKNWSDGGSETSAIRNFALYLDEAPENLSYVEADIEKYITEQTRPVLNYSSNQVSLDRPSFSCRSYGIGSSVYTDCN